jgi:carbamoyl-phosphate synthase small subunit
LLQAAISISRKTVIIVQIMKARLTLEDGTVFKGFSFGADCEGRGEVVFNTSMTGYQEILTDPSYRGQIVCMTYPLIGNYGVNGEDIESERIQVEGFIVKEASRIASNWRSEGEFRDYLQRHGIPGIEGIDTRALTRLLREKGSLRGIISTSIDDDQELVNEARSIPEMIGRNLADEVTASGINTWNEKGRYHVVVIDCGVKYNILRELEKRDCRITIVSSKTGTDEIMRLNPHGVLISNGPGDPEPVENVIEVARNLLGKIPLFGICLGHQIIGLALGGKTYKLKFGHHGGNHPVKDLQTGKIAITVQNHNFCVDIDSLNKEEIEITHMNLNDNTLEGFKHKTLPVFSVQFHPEASPGPNDSKYLFREFIEMMGNNAPKK